MNVTEEFTTINIKPSRSAPIRFKGKLLAETEWDTADGGRMIFEIWQSVGGALIAVREGEDDQGHGYTDAIVVEPGIEAATDEAGMSPFAMRDAVMTFYGYHDRARSLVKRKLKWSILREVA